MAEITLESLVEEVHDLTILPTAITKIMELSNDPDSTIKDMEEAILTDQTLTSKVLRLANSAYYGYARRISNLSQATVLLGFETIKSIALASTVSGYMEGEFEGYALDKNELWLQSQTCAIICRHIAQRTKAFNPETAYIAGLLRDIGKTILNDYMIDKYNDVLELILTNRMPFAQAEQEVFGFDHCDLGAEVARKWNLPEILCDAIKHHHDPDDSDMEDKSLVSIVHIADAMTMMMGVGIGLDGLTYRLSPQALTELDLSVDDFKEIISEATDLIKDQDSFFLRN